MAGFLEDRNKTLTEQISTAKQWLQSWVGASWDEGGKYGKVALSSQPIVTTIDYHLGSVYFHRTTLRPLHDFENKGANAATTATRKPSSMMHKHTCHVYIFVKCCSKNVFKVGITWPKKWRIKHKTQKWRLNSTKNGTKAPQNNNCPAVSV